VTAIINGRRRELRIVGVALTPEYIYGIRPGDMLPDDIRFGIFWMGRKALATAYNMEGGFNDVSLKLMRGASVDEVIVRLDRVLDAYGGLGAVPRAQQLSHWYLENELNGIQGAGSIIPMIFMAVAAFLLNVVLTRIVTLQREQIAALKALGYGNGDLAWHFIKMSLIIGFLGAVIGVVGGAWVGSGLTSLYATFFRFPILRYHLSPALVVVAATVSFVASVLGAIGAVRSAVTLPPAEAMRPEAPASYRETMLERIGFKRLLSPPARMILRNLQRRPFRTGVSVVGIGFAGAMMIVGTFSLDAMDVLFDLQFNVAQRQDMTVTFTEPASAAALHEIRRLPGVVYAEPMRSVPARLRFGHRERQVGILGLDSAPELQRVVDASFREVPLPPEGLVLSTALAEILAAGPGDVLTVEVLEGARPVLEIPVAGLVEEYMGTAVYMEIEALHRLVREGGTLSGGVLKVDPAIADRLYGVLKAIPAVAGVNLKRAAIESFEKTIAEMVGMMITFNVMFSSIIAFGVVYNNARISLSERSRELATLRVVGFTRAEISFILLGELAVVTLLAVPLGFLIGYGLSAMTVTAFSSELFRFPLVIAPRTFFFSAVTVIAAAAVSGLAVRRRLDKLDLIAVLKTRE
jgi:putative ABC transport system permease protein